MGGHCVSALGVLPPAAPALASESLLVCRRHLLRDRPPRLHPRALLGIANRLRRVGRPRALVDANRAERAGLEHANQLQPDHLEQRQERDDQAGARRRTSANRSSKPHASVSDSRASSCSMRSSIGICSAGSKPSAAAWRARRPPGTRVIRLKRSTSISGSCRSPAISAIAAVGPRPLRAAQRLALVQQLGRGLELLVLEQPAHQRLARILVSAIAPAPDRAAAAASAT